MAVSLTAISLNVYWGTFTRMALTLGAGAIDKLTPAQKLAKFPTLFRLTVQEINFGKNFSDFFQLVLKALFHFR